MSHQAIVWALKQPVKPAPAKQILTVMAHYVSATQGGPWVAFPSVSQLVKDTGQDRKTVMVNIKRLEEAGYIVDTGEREGVTKSVPVYQLSAPYSSTENGTPSDDQSGTKSGTAVVPEAVPETGRLSSTKSGTSIEEGSSTNFSGKQYQIPPEAVPDFPTEQVEQVLGTGVETTSTPPTYTRVRETPSSASQVKEHVPDQAHDRATQIAVLLIRNGACRRSTRSDNRAVIELVQLQASDVQILGALETAKRQRVKSGSAQPVTAAYLVPIVRDLQAQPEPTTRSRYAEDIRQLREMSAWADEQLRNDRGCSAPIREIHMGAIDATRND